jgi:hypothetical protein
VAACEVFNLQPNIDGKLVDRVVDAFEPFIKFFNEPFGLV